MTSLSRLKLYAVDTVLNDHPTFYVVSANVLEAYDLVLEMLADFRGSPVQESEIKSVWCLSTPVRLSAGSREIPNLTRSDRLVMAPAWYKKIYAAGEFAAADKCVRMHRTRVRAVESPKSGAWGNPVHAAAARLRIPPGTPVFSFSVYTDFKSNPESRYLFCAYCSGLWWAREDEARDAAKAWAADDVKYGELVEAAITSRAEALKHRTIGPGIMDYSPSKSEEEE